MPIDLSAAAQTAFANVASAALSWHAQRGFAHAPGGFVRKKLKGSDYWYHQVKAPNGKPLQTYIGRASPELDELIESRKNSPVDAAEAHLRRLSMSAIQLGCHEIVPKHATVLDRLHNHGFFAAGGVLIGTHCFLAYQNMFGVTWTGGATTLDIDFAHAGKNVSVALPQVVDAHAAIESLKMGFIPNSDRTSYKKADEPDFDLDFLTSMGRSGAAPVHVPALNIWLQPLRFMEFAMEAAAPAVLLTRRGPLVVNMPPPERYAVHKLLVYGERPQKERTKALKDLMQVAELVAYLTENDPDALSGAWSNLIQRGPGWRSRAQTGLEALVRQHRDLDVSCLAIA